MTGGLPRSRSQMINVSIVLSTGVHTSLLLLSFCHADLLFLTRTTMRAIQGAGRCFLTLPSGPRKNTSHSHSHLRKGGPGTC